ncbi:MAG: L-threonine 3-dehydrogenase [Gammaproteobacteria bacterium]|nr:MAG: L-threonine 3-dehydrogenase [Gammaproteobacteria bacterium]RLA24485.1 MAG: L-threonine 3-dehydrogenase [Gammaproteobacteria bacterium]
MLALCKVLPEIGGLSLEEVAIPEPQAGEVRVKVAFTGICGTDLHIHNWIPFASSRMKLPTILGHEFSGVVDAIGEGVSKASIDDFVSIESHISCGRCYTCHMGQENLCMNTRYPGVEEDGGFASYAVVPEKLIWQQSSEITPQIAAMFEPFGIAVHASLKGRGVSGMNVLVAGCGPIGLMNIIAARALGANRVIATDVSPVRLKQAQELGADKVINVSDAKSNPVKTIKDMTQGNGVDVSFEYSGVPESLDLAIHATVAGGELRLIGVPAGPSLVNLEAILLKGLTIHNISGRKLFSSWEHASKLIRDKQVDLNPLISHVLPLKEVERGFELLLKGEGIKVLVQPE